MLRDALPQRRAVPAADASAEPFEHMREQLRQGIKVASVPQLFPTPRELALRLVDEAKVCAGERVLEPSAGTGELVSAIISRGLMGLERGQVVAVELNHTLAEALRTRRSKTLYASEENYDVRCADFLQCTVEQMGTFHRVVMNPPFDDEVAHVTPCPRLPQAWRQACLCHVDRGLVPARPQDGGLPGAARAAGRHN
jgi:tRNA1(Val) A37 N6-methylase TrmN6